jgi:uncharacterized protein YabN with tetrapyrrole methylase and pyrophosphatase domain
MKKKGSLVIIGTGIQLGDFGILAKSYLQNTEKLLYLVADDLTEYWIKQLNPKAESLEGYYGENKNRIDSYMGMVDKMMEYVRKGYDVCTAFYGHPGIFVTPSHIAIEQAKKEGYHAEMLPGISAEDWLFADLGINPGDVGCQSFEATDFLVYTRKFDVRSHLIVWQIGVVGNLKFNRVQPGEKYFNILIEYLLKFYSSQQDIIVYEAAQYVTQKPKIIKRKLSKLKFKDTTPISTLYIPPAKDSKADLNMLKRLGIALNL